MLTHSGWEEALSHFCIDWEASARHTGALLRRRGVKRAVDLLRMVFAYAACDYSLRMLGAWFTLLGLGSLSNVAILNRLRGCSQWLGTLIVSLLQQRRIRMAARPGVRLRLVDATIVSKPGSKGIDWRLHLSLDLGHLCLDGVSVTDMKGGESLVRCPTRPGDILVADRGLAFLRSIGSVLMRQAHLVVRTNIHNLSLRDMNGKRFEICEWLQSLDCPSEHQVWIHVSKNVFPLRLIACPLPPKAVETARRKARKLAEKEGYTPSQNTLLSAGFILLVSNLPDEQWDLNEILLIYRLRWQIELYFKRLKSILNLDGLRAQDPQLTQTYLLGKLLSAMFIDEFIQATNDYFPDWFTSTEHPASLWRITMLYWDQFRYLVRGAISLNNLVMMFPHLRRYLCDTPRKRIKQLVQAHSLLMKLSIS